jgi:rubrerythrin
MEKTLENLGKAFIGESQARNRYDFYAGQAKKAGFEQIASVFEETAGQERMHAKKLFQMMQDIKQKLGAHDSALNVEAEAPTILSDLPANLKAAIEGEHYEHSTIYPDFAKVAEEEGLPEVAKRLLAIAKAEKHHEERFQSLLGEVENNTVFQKPECKNWVCRKCGYAHDGQCPPGKCPACEHPQSYFQLRCETY